MAAQPLFSSAVSKKDRETIRSIRRAATILIAAKRRRTRKKESSLFCAFCAFLRLLPLGCGCRGADWPSASLARDRVTSQSAPGFARGFLQRMADAFAGDVHLSSPCPSKQREKCPLVEQIQIYFPAFQQREKPAQRGASAFIGRKLPRRRRHLPGSDSSLHPPTDPLRRSWGP